MEVTYHNMYQLLWDGSTGVCFLFVINHWKTAIFGYQLSKVSKGTEIPLVLHIIFFPWIIWLLTDVDYSGLFLWTVGCKVWEQHFPIDNMNLHDGLWSYNGAKMLENESSIIKDLLLQGEYHTAGESWLDCKCTLFYQCHLRGWSVIATQFQRE